MTVYVGDPVAEGVRRCAGCRRQHLPLWRDGRRAVCASCLTRRLCAGGSLEPIAFYPDPRAADNRTAGQP